MTTKLTAEHVKFRLRELAELDELGLRTANAAYEHAGDIVRDNLIESPDERRERFEAWMQEQWPRSVDPWQVWNAALDFGGGGGE